MNGSNTFSGKLVTFLQGLQQSVATTARIVLLSKWRNILNISKKPSNTRCIVLANGPSLNATILKYESLLIKSDTLAVNGFIFSDEILRIQPRFYLVSAKNIFYPRASLSPLYQKLQDDIFNGLMEKVTWEMYFMVPFSAKKSVEFKLLLEKNPRIKPLYFNLTPIEGFKFYTHFLFKKKLGSPRPHNVVIPGIMNLISLNYKEIYLTGVDHSWLDQISVNEKNEALVNQKHFYDEHTSKSEKMEDSGIRPRRLHEIIHKFYLSFKGYWEIEQYAKTRNVNIYNSSEVSMIDAFERKSLKDLE